MAAQKLVVRIRGDDDLGVRRVCSGIGQARGWSVTEQTAFVEPGQEMMTLQVYEQEFDDDAEAKEALAELEAAIAEVSTFAVVIC